MAISSFKSFLMKGTGSPLTYSKLVDIKDFPDISGAPQALETTTLSDAMQTFVSGIKTSAALTFTANYTAEDFTALQALEGAETPFAVWFGGTETGGVVTPDGSDGKFSFSGELSVFVTGAAVNAIVGMTITIVPTSAITYAAS